jgi:leader peptidase (prepilin peptidase)/N-methyltransferase
MMPPVALLGAFGLVAAGLAGLIVGSFLNVVAHRLPRDESIAFPGSRCPACGVAIKAYDNIPVLSWILLGGRCRACRAPIALRYPALELGNAVLWLLVFRFAPSWCDFATGAFLCSAALVLLAIDFEHWILPDAITKPGILLGLALSFGSAMRSPVNAALGAVLGAGGLYLMAFVYEKVSGKEGMGLGDVKMLGMIGALLGVGGMIFTIMVGSLTGSAVGVWMWFRSGRRLPFRDFLRETELQFGVFLGLGSVAAWFFSDWVIGLYLERMFPAPL